MLVKVDEKYVHNVAINSRGGEIIEPQIKLQWFVDVNKEFEQNGRNANPMIPYSFIKVASIMNNNAHLSFPLLEKEYPSKIHPHIRALDCNHELLFISS